MLNNVGYYHSIETMGAVDGPGIRFILFLSGCTMRCLYCHNPDTWSLNKGKEITVEEVWNLFEKKKNFYQNGGITISGGEPTLQLDFLISLCQKFKQNNIHVCVDTSAVLFTEQKQVKYEQLIKYVDLFLIDIKTMNPQKHVTLTKQKSQPVFDFINFLEQKNKKFWIRHVIVPNLTTNEEELIKLGKYVKTLKNMAKLQLLPYHSMAIFKYKELNLKYPLLTTPDCGDLTLKKAQEFVAKGLK